MKGTEIVREIRHNNEFGIIRFNIIMFFIVLQVRDIVETLNKPND